MKFHFTHRSVTRILATVSLFLASSTLRADVPIPNDKSSPAEMRIYGDALYFGQGMTLDRASGLRWLKRAADKGDARAFTLLGDASLDEGNQAQSLEFYLTASAKEDGVGSVNAGRLLNDGNGAARDIIRANKLYETGLKMCLKQAKLGDARAMNTIGRVYENGLSGICVAQMRGICMH